MHKEDNFLEYLRARNSVKKRFLSKLIKEVNPEILIVQESKVEKFEFSEIKCGG